MDEYNSYFIVVDLFPYRAAFGHLNTSCWWSCGAIPSPLPTLPAPQPFKMKIKAILADYTNSIQGHGDRRHLVKWHDHPPSRATWIIENAFLSVSSALLVITWNFTCWIWVLFNRGARELMEISDSRGFHKYSRRGREQIWFDLV